MLVLHASLATPFPNQTATLLIRRVQDSINAVDDAIECDNVETVEPTNSVKRDLCWRNPYL